MIRRLTLALACAAFAHTAASDTQTTEDPARGELLYQTHCITCHSAEVHWRDKRVAVDWASLKSEVNRWQEHASLGWDDADIVEVTRYVNASYYHFPAPQ